MKDNDCVLGPDSTCYQKSCRYWDLQLQRCVYREIKEAEQERRRRHENRFKDDGVEERIRIT